MSINDLKAYLVGGAVRDMLLGVTPQDKDWVVVGSTPEQMIALGFTRVGADFPVFLHPVTKDEYALARQERKIGSGRHSFSVSFHPDTTLEDDLSRRDLTINAMAWDVSNSKLIDPWGGADDLNRKKLRHISDAFSEDPLRVFRLARFIAKTGFECATETFDLCSQMCQTNLLSEVSPERFYSEFDKMALHRNFSNGLQFLSDCNALSWFDPTWPSRIDKLLQYPQNKSFYDLSPAFKCSLSLGPCDLPTCESLCSKLRFANPYALASKRMRKICDIVSSNQNAPLSVILTNIIEAGSLHKASDNDYAQNLYQCSQALLDCSPKNIQIPFDLDTLNQATNIYKSADVRLAVADNPINPRKAALEAKIAAISDFLDSRPSNLRLISKCC